MTESTHGGGAIPEWTLGDRMRKARENAGLKQADLAREIGIGRASVVNYESGRSTPSRPVLLAWAFRCGVPLEWLRPGITMVGFKMTCSWTPRAFRGNFHVLAHLAAA